MRKRVLPQKMRKRVLASLLVIALSVPTTNMPIFASQEELKPAHYDPDIVQGLQKLCTNGEKAVDVLDNLRSKGIVDETGELIEAQTFNVNGKIMAEDELAKEAQNHSTGNVTVDGEKLSWDQVKQSIELKNSLKAYQEFTKDDVEINETNKKAYLESAASLQAQLAQGDVLVYSDPNSSTYGAGISHQARIKIIPDRTTISCTGNDQTITVTASLVQKQSVAVSFNYQTISGSASAEGSGKITFNAGETEKKFNIKYHPSKTPRNGQSIFCIECNNVKNALIDGGAFAGRNLTIPITVSQSKTMVYQHTLNAKVTCSPTSSYRTQKKKKIYTYTKNMKCYINNTELAPILSNSSVNTYSFTHRVYPTFSTSGVTVDGIGERTFYYDKIEGADKFKWEFVTKCSKEGEDYEYKGGISGYLSIKEVHEKIGLTGLKIPDGTFYSGQIVPITATFNEKIKNLGNVKLKLSNGTTLSPKERTSSITDSVTFLYQVPEKPSGSIPSITELSI